MKGFLVLEDGTVFRGESVGAEGFAFGEAVFTTAMTGYQEVVTDPSFAEQIVCFTAPMVGNYGVAAARSESGHVFVRAALMREARGPAWTDWLVERSIPALSGVDTRSLVVHLRERGAMKSAVVVGDCSIEEALRAVGEQPSMDGRALAAEVSTREPYVAAAEGRVRIAVVDYGCKRSIVRRLLAAGAAVTVFPHDVDASELSRHDGVLLSNGPGDPGPLREEAATVRELLGKVPLLGICLGHQLLALATGHETFKLKFGHRGANHPVLERESGRVLVTSQNHGFAVAPPGEDADGAAVVITHESLYDRTVEGLRVPGRPVWSMQFHPEASPGPHDARDALVRFVEIAAQHAAAPAPAAEAS